MGALGPTRCCVPGCHRRGIYSAKSDGRGPWYCRQHERAREQQQVTQARIAAEMLFFAPTQETPND